MSLDCPQLKLFAQINQLWNKLFERPCFKCRAIEPDISSAVVYVVDWATLDPFPPYNFALVDKNQRFWVVYFPLYHVPFSPCNNRFTAGIITTVGLVIVGDIRQWNIFICFSKLSKYSLETSLFTSALVDLVLSAMRFDSLRHWIKLDKLDIFSKLL